MTECNARFAGREKQAAAIAIATSCKAGGGRCGPELPAEQREQIDRDYFLVARDEAAI
jgi:hypothetical protein